MTTETPTDTATQSPPDAAGDRTISATATEESAVSSRVEVRIDARRVRKAFDRAYRDLGRQVRVKGFRPGKAPRRVLERLYGSSIAEEIERTLVSETLPDAIEQTGLEPVATPDIEAGPPAPDTDFVYHARVEVKPTIALGSLEGLPATKPRVEVPEEDIERELESLRERNAPLVEEPDGTEVADGHVLSVDFVGRVDGEPFEGGTGRDVEIGIGEGRFIPGFEEQLVGATAGEDRVLSVTFPEDYGNAELAGKQAEFDVHVAAVKKRQIPDLDDEFAKDLGDFDTLDALKERIRADLTEMRERASKAELHRTLLDAALERTPFEVPTGLVEQQLMRQLRSAEQRLGQSIPEDALREQLHRWQHEWRPAAEREVREALLLEAVAADQEIVVEEAEVTARIERMAAEQGVPADRFREALGEDAVAMMARRQLGADKALDFLVSAAKVEETTDT